MVAAGNTKADSCTIAPGNVNGTLNMAASDLASKFMERPPAGVKDGNISGFPLPPGAPGPCHSHP